MNLRKIIREAIVNSLEGKETPIWCKYFNTQAIMFSDDDRVFCDQCMMQAHNSYMSDEENEQLRKDFEELHTIHGKISLNEARQWSKEGFDTELDCWNNGRGNRDENADGPNLGYLKYDPIKSRTDGHIMKDQWICSYCEMDSNDPLFEKIHQLPGLVKSLNESISQKERAYQLGFSEGERDRALNQASDILAGIRALLPEYDFGKAFPIEYARGYINGSRMEKDIADKELNKVIAYFSYHPHSMNEQKMYPWEKQSCENKRIVCYNNGSLVAQRSGDGIESKLVLGVGGQCRCARCDLRKDTPRFNQLHDIITEAKDKGTKWDLIKKIRMPSPQQHGHVIPSKKKYDRKKEKKIVDEAMVTVGPKNNLDELVIKALSGKKVSIHCKIKDEDGYLVLDGSRIYCSVCGAKLYDENLPKINNKILGARFLKNHEIGKLNEAIELWPGNPAADVEGHIGTLFTLNKFIKLVKEGAFIDYDGHGYYSFGWDESEKIVRPSDIMHGKTDRNFTHIVWYNR